MRCLIWPLVPDVNWHAKLYTIFAVLAKDELAEHELSLSHSDEILSKKMEIKGESGDLPD